MPLQFFGIAYNAFLVVMHYLSVIPLYAGRTQWISSFTGADLRTVSQASAFDVTSSSMNLNEIVKDLTVAVVAKSRCGVCNGTNGKNVGGDDATVFTRNGRKNAIQINF